MRRRCVRRRQRFISASVRTGMVIIMEDTGVVSIMVADIMDTTGMLITGTAGIGK